MIYFASILVGKPEIDLEATLSQHVVILFVVHFGFCLDSVAVKELCKDSGTNMTIEARFCELIHFVALFPELVLNLLRSHIDALMEIFEASVALIHLGDVYFATSGFEGLAAFVAEKLWEYALIASDSLKRVVALVIFDIFTLDWFDAEM